MRNHRSMVNLDKVTVVHLNVGSGYLTYLAGRDLRNRPIVKGIPLTK